MFKVGQPVVCVKQARSRRHICEGRPEPIKGEIYTFDGFYNGTHIGLIEMHPDSCFLIDLFRPIDYSFGEKLAEELQEEINQEQLISK